MSEPESGDTVTFLFTNIEDSSHLWEQHSNQMGLVFAQYAAMIKHSVEQNNGYIFKTIGNAFCAAFTTASAALKAAYSSQLALTTSHWEPEIGPLKVRMALHTGVAEMREGDYFGQSLNRVAALLSTGHGGQILLSAATQELVRDHLPENTSVHDLGEHRLQTLTRPERVFQLVSATLLTDFPALKSLSSFPTNLPLQLTSFIGREREITEIKECLTQTRLLTLIGSGGSGKTRLSLQVAAELLESFEGGVWLIELAPLADPKLVAQAVATILNLKEEPHCPIITTLTNYLQPKTLLLILDNCEHLVEQVAQISETLLKACSNLRILASSRESLGVAGETTYRVPSLTLPDQNTTITSEKLNEFEAIRLFVERARASRPDFRVTSQNSPSIMQICATLDGIPLAIELAAARVNVLSIEQIAVRLSDCFQLLTGGKRTALPRHQTLRGAIDWSYNLLSEAEQSLWQRLTVFAGGWTLEAAEAVCSGEGIEPPEVLDLLSQLINKSLVIMDEVGTTTRFHLLETLRQYGQEKLELSDYMKPLQRRYAHYFLSLAEELGPKLFEDNQDERVARARLEVEHANLRTVLEWALSQENTSMALTLGAALSYFWWNSYNTEGWNYLQRILTMPPLEDSESVANRARCLNGCSWLAVRRGNKAEARRLGEEGLELFLRLGDQRGIGRTNILFAGLANLEKDEIGAQRYAEEAVQALRDTPHLKDYLLSLNMAGVIIMNQGDYVTARSYFEEIRSLTKTQRGKLVYLGNLALLLLLQGEYLAAQTYCRECLSLSYEFGWSIGIPHTLAVFAALASHLSRNAPTITAKLDYLTRTACLCGAVDISLTRSQTKLDLPERDNYNEAKETSRTILGEEAFDTAFAEGEAMTLDQAVEYALSMEIISQPGRPVEAVSTSAITPDNQNSNKLTRRELEVLKLVAEGLTDPQIAENLSLSPRTVNAHLRTIFSKLDVTTRTAATRYAIEQNLV